MRIKCLTYDTNELYQDSKYTEWRAVYLLLGEIRETVNQLGFETSLPTIAGRCAVACLMVLHEPLNKMYGKVNRYLQRRPWWEVEKIPSYWIDQILLHEPEDDEGHYDEVNWLLDMLVNGLQTLGVSHPVHPNIHEVYLSRCTGPKHLPPRKRIRAYPISLQCAILERGHEEESPPSPI